jgi:hypothetical protein
MQQERFLLSQPNTTKTNVDRGFAWINGLMLTENVLYEVKMN